MKTSDPELELSAYVDGELEPARRAEVERWLASNPEARALVTELTRTRDLLQVHEPAARVAESREFYWSQIRRRIEAGEARSEARPSAGLLAWLRWVVPVVGVAAVALLLTGPLTGRGSLSTGSADALAQAGGEASSVVFRSESDGVTIHWLN